MNKFVIVRKEQLASIGHHDDLDKAILAAGEMASSDKEPRYVVRMIAEVAHNPTPPPVVTRFDGADHD